MNIKVWLDHEMNFNDLLRVQSSWNTDLSSGIDGIELIHVHVVVVITNCDGHILLLSGHLWGFFWPEEVWSPTLRHCNFCSFEFSNLFTKMFFIRTKYRFRLLTLMEDSKRFIMSRQSSSSFLLIITNNNDKIIIMMMLYRGFAPKCFSQDRQKWSIKTVKDVLFHPDWTGFSALEFWWPSQDYDEFGLVNLGFIGFLSFILGFFFYSSSFSPMNYLKFWWFNSRATREALSSPRFCSDKQRCWTSCCSYFASFSMHGILLAMFNNDTMSS